MADIKSELEQIKDSLIGLGAGIVKEALPSFDGLINAFDEMTKKATLLNNVFGQNRTRITELQQAVADTAPRIAGLGGDMSDVFDTMEGVSKALKRNVVGTADDYSRLFAAQKILGGSVQEMVSDFNDIGVQFSLIGGQLKSSIDYIQNMGLNTKQVMQDVQNNMKRINEFNFADGVQGLTKMAAQAALFRFDMSDTFQLMEKSLSPDGAIELASAFQRMGVAAGDLTDPFQLMYKSLNDPAGLQKSIIDMTKNYTEFDSKTKTFKINPEGMLQLREISKQTGLSYDNLTKSALATANLDRAFKQLRPSINFEKEEDRELIGSIATMNEKTGEYEINVKNDVGTDIKTKLSDLSQEQINKLLEEEKKKPKTLEDYAKNQMDALQSIMADARAIRTSFEFGVVSNDEMRNLSEKMRDVATSSATELKNFLPKPEDYRGFTSDAINNIKGIVQEMASGNLGSDKMVEAYNKLKEQFNEVINKGDDKSKALVSKLEENFKKIVDSPKLSYKGSLGTAAGQPTKTPTTSKVELGGGLTFNVVASPNVNKQQFEQFINSPEFRDKFLEIFKNLDPNARATIKKSLGF
jgi:hypothetical protein